MALPKNNGEVDFQSRLAPMEKVNAYNRWMHSVYAPYIGKRVLEVGAGTGNLSGLYARQVEYALCVDVEPPVLEVHKRRHGCRPNMESMLLNVMETDLKPLKDKGFDTILCINVLEHIKEDRSMLEIFKDILSPGGRAVVLVPAFNTLYSYLDENVGHFRRYDRGVLWGMAKELGFEVEMKRYFNFFGLLVVYIQSKRKAPKERGEGFSGMVDEKSSKLINAAAAVLRPVEKFIHPPAGVSEIVVLKKPKGMAKGGIKCSRE